jgi:hypothetical protein
VSEPDRINVEAILDDLYASEINVEISWLWDGGIDVKVGRRRNRRNVAGRPAPSEARYGDRAALNQTYVSLCAQFACAAERVSKTHSQLQRTRVNIANVEHAVFPRPHPPVPAGFGGNPQLDICGGAPAFADTRAAITRGDLYQIIKIVEIFRSY